MPIPYVLVSEMEQDATRLAPTQAWDGDRLETIREMSALLDSICNRRFDEWIETRAYTALSINAQDGATSGDLLSSRELSLDRELQTLQGLSVVGSSISLSGVQLLPLNGNYKNIVRLGRSAALSSFYVSGGEDDAVGAIEVAGLWRHSGEWKGTGVTLAADVNASATNLTASAAEGIEAGMLLRIDSEYLMVEAVNGTTVTVDREFNGSTAVSHTTGAAFYRFHPLQPVKTAVKGMVQWWIAARQNPMFGSVVIGDFQYAMLPESFPKHVMATIKSAKLRRAAEVRAG